MIIENIARAYEATYTASERKLSGTHYTPDNVIGYIIEKTIDVGINCVDDFRQFRVIDPACGSGLFLLKAFDVICAARLKKDGVISPQVARAVLENCLYGIDIDAAAITAAQQSLLQKAEKFGVRHAKITSHFCTGDALDRWSIQWQSEKDNFVLYPHKEINGKVLPVDLNLFPHAKKYLHLHREKLASRTYLQEAGRRWYEIWVHQSPMDFSKIKIITPDISSTNRFALDRKGFFVNGTCFYIILKDQSLETNFAVLALLNSKLIEYFHKMTNGNVLYAKRFRYWSTYLSQYPVPKSLDSEHALVQKLADHARRLETLSLPNDIRELEDDIDRMVYNLFELSASEFNEIEATLKRNRLAQPE